MRYKGSDFVLVVPLNDKPSVGDPQSRSTIEVLRQSRIYWRLADTLPLKNHRPDYLGVRVRGKLESVHRIIDCEKLTAGARSRLLPGLKLDREHIIFKVGDSIGPTHEVKSGRIFAPGHQWCTLASLGKHKTVGEAAVPVAWAAETEPFLKCL